MKTSDLLGLNLDSGQTFELGPRFASFADHGPEIGSIALARMTIWEPARQALLAFGSPDPNAFTSDMGSELVTFLARVCQRTAERWPVL